MGPGRDDDDGWRMGNGNLHRGLKETAAARKKSALHRGRAHNTTARCIHVYNGIYTRRPGGGEVEFCLTDRRASGYEGGHGVVCVCVCVCVSGQIIHLHAPRTFART